MWLEVNLASVLALSNQKKAPAILLVFVTSVQGGEWAVAWQRT